MKRVEQFIYNPLWCYKCHKYRHHKDKCDGRSVCGERDPDSSTKECKKTHRCANCGEDHPVYAKNLQKWKCGRKKKSKNKKNTRNVFPRGTEDRWLYRHKTYSQVVSLITSTEPTSKYQNLVWKPLKLGPGDWSNFIINLKAKLKEPKMKRKVEGEKGHQYTAHSTR